MLRMAGLALLGLCLLLIRWLFHAAALRHRQDPSIVEIAAAEVALLSFSIGGVLATFGAHIFDPVELSTRWIEWPCPFARDTRAPLPVRLR